MKSRLLLVKSAFSYDHVHQWWIIPRIVSGFAHPSYLHGIRRVHLFQLCDDPRLWHEQNPHAWNVESHLQPVISPSISHESVSKSGSEKKTITGGSTMNHPFFHHFFRCSLGPSCIAARPDPLPGGRGAVCAVRLPEARRSGSKWGSSPMAVAV